MTFVIEVHGLAKSFGNVQAVASVDFNVRKGELYPDGWTNENEATAITGGTPGQTLDALMQPLPEAAAPPDV